MVVTVDEVFSRNDKTIMRTTEMVDIAQIVWIVDGYDDVFQIVFLISNGEQWWWMWSHFSDSQNDCNDT